MSASQLRPRGVLRHAGSMCVSLPPEYLIHALPTESATSPFSPNTPNRLPVSFRRPVPAPCFGVLGDQNPFEIHSRECQRLRSNGLIEAAPAAADNRNPETVAPG